MGPYRGLVLRELTIRDYDEIIDLWRNAGLPFRPKDRDSRKDMRRTMAEFPDLHIGIYGSLEIGKRSERGHASKKERLLGVVIASYEGRKGWINRLAVHPEARHRGLGKLLIKEGEARIRARGASMFCALIEGDNKTSMALFKASGYERMDEVVYFRKNGGGGC